MDSVCASLIANGVSAACYGRWSKKADGPDAALEAFYSGKIQVLMTTGDRACEIDHSTISFVIHYDLPDSLDNYYRDISRVRDSAHKTHCVLLASRSRISKLVNEPVPIVRKKAISSSEYEALLLQRKFQAKALVAYCFHSGCLMSFLLDYLGQHDDSDCGRCCNCVYDSIFKTEPRVLKIIEDAICEIEATFHGDVNCALLIRVLRGGKDKRIRTLGYNKLSCYGKLSNLSRPEVQATIDLLVKHGFASYVHGSPGTLRPTGRSKKAS